MVALKQDSKRFVKMPTLDDWAKAKERHHEKMARLPFAKKIKLIEEMHENEVKFEDAGKQS